MSNQPPLPGTEPPYRKSELDFLHAEMGDTEASREPIAPESPWTTRDQLGSVALGGLSAREEAREKGHAEIRRTHNLTGPIERTPEEQQRVTDNVAWLKRIARGEEPAPEMPEK